MMSGQGQSSDNADEIARGWYLRLVSGDVRRGEMRALEDWIAAAPAHDEAFRRARAVYMSAAGDPTRVPRKVEARVRRARSRVLAGAACAAVAFALAVPSLPWLLADQSTRTGEVRRIDLADGTIAYLDTASAIDTDFSDNIRVVKLEAGRVWFDVARDRRPFHVKAGDVDITDIGTAFSVGLHARSGVDVAVERGIVDVRTSGGTQRLFGGVEASFPSAASPVIGQASDLVFAWRGGRLVFADRPLSDVVAEIGRYRRGIVYVNDRTVARRRVSAILSLDALDGGLAALAESQGLEVRHFTPWVTILTRKK